jgi:hypothetical protein
MTGHRSSNGPVDGEITALPRSQSHPGQKNLTNSTNFGNPPWAFTLKPTAMSLMASLHDD